MYDNQKRELTFYTSRKNLILRRQTPSESDNLQRSKTDFVSFEQKIVLLFRGTRSFHTSDQLNLKTLLIN